MILLSGIQHRKDMRLYCRGSKNQTFENVG